jgi:hypothetical protein
MNATATASDRQIELFCSWTSGREVPNPIPRSSVATVDMINLQDLGTDSEF